MSSKWLSELYMCGNTHIIDKRLVFYRGHSGKLLLKVCSNFVTIALKCF